MMDDARHIWAPATSFMISDPWQPGYGAKTVGYLTHRFHADGAHDHALTPVRGLVHHDLAEISGAYGDVRSWGPGKA
jgi:3',5'-cyclic-AMP phosphodiesterase